MSEILQHFVLHFLYFHLHSTIFLSFEYDHTYYHNYVLSIQNQIQKKNAIYFSQNCFKTSTFSLSPFIDNNLSLHTLFLVFYSNLTAYLMNLIIIASNSNILKIVDTFFFYSNHIQYHKVLMLIAWLIIWWQIYVLQCNELLSALNIKSFIEKWCKSWNIHVDSWMTSLFGNLAFGPGCQ